MYMVMACFLVKNQLARLEKRILDFCKPPAVHVEIATIADVTVQE